MLKNLVRGLALICLTVLAVAPASAAELKVVKDVTIAASPDKVWAIIQNFSDLTWHPAVKSSSATDGNNKGSVRTLDLGGPKLIEQLVAYNATKMNYTYKITDDPANIKTMPVTKYTSTIAVKKGSGNTTVVTWSGKFLRADPSPTPAAGMDDAAATKAITGVYEGGLAGLKKKLEGS